MPDDKNPSDKKSMNDFAIAINKIQKVIFYRTLKHADWKSAKLASRDIEEVVSALQQQRGKDILVGGRSLII